MYRLTREGEALPERYDTATQAIRGMTRTIRAQPLTDDERSAFAHWYTHLNYRAVAFVLRRRQRFELRVSVGGERQTFAIDPPPPLPFERPQKVPVMCECADTT